MPPDSSEHATDGSETEIDRRTILKAAGASAMAGVGLVGTASAHDVDGPPVFCGCSQVCACGTGTAGVLVAVEEDEGFSFTWISDNEFNFCLSIDDPGVPDGKIIAVQVDGTRWINPNTCAQKALAAEQEQLYSTHPRPEGESGGPCGKPPCEHPGRRNGLGIFGREKGSSNAGRGKGPSNPGRGNGPSNPGRGKGPSNAGGGNGPSNAGGGKGPSNPGRGKGPSNVGGGKGPSNAGGGKGPSNAGGGNGRGRGRGRGR